MAGTDQGAADLFESASSLVLLEPTGWPAGIHAGVGAPGGVWTTVPIDLDLIGGPRTNVDRPALVRGAGTARGVVTDSPDDVTPMGNGVWWERMHLVPLDPIEFGNIITQEEEAFEIYNAHRSLDVTLSSISNSITPGIELPDTLVGNVCESQSSLLRNTSTGNTSGSGLGTLVQMRIQALTDGLPVFDGDIVFAFGIGSVTLTASGSRVVLVPFEFEEPMELELQFLTDRNESESGKQQRIALRGGPREVFQIVYRLDESQRQFMHAILFDNLDKQVAIPAWQNRLELLADVSAGATSYQVSGALSEDFRVGGLAAVIQDDYTFDVLNLTAVTDTLLTSTDPSLNGYSSGAYVVPIRLGYLNPPRTGRYSTSIEDFALTFEGNAEIAGIVAASSAPGFWSTLNGKVFLNNCNVIRSRPGGAYRQNVTVIDNQTGKVTRVSTNDRAKRTSSRNFTLRGRQQVTEMKALLHYLNGGQRQFYVPSDIEDLTAVSNLATASADLDIRRIGYDRFVRSRGGMNRIRITLTNGTTIDRVIQSSAVLTSTTERLTVNTTWGADYDLSEIRRIEFVDLVNFVNDRFVFRYVSPGVVQLDATVVRDFNE